MPPIAIQYYPTPVGELLIGTFEDRLCICDWRYRRQRDTVDKRIQTGLNANFVEEDNAVLQQTRRQLAEYFEAGRREFDLPLHMVGTAFQQKVWNALLAIPYGETATYLQLTERLGQREAIRAVANANGANALSIIVPCHRIIGSQGEMVGYAGGLQAKKQLLLLENARFAQKSTQQLSLDF
jgi:methylated-DNA-[protein]-cysteine S-methyltransferase